MREPDVVVFMDSKGEEWVQDKGGTSLFDKANMFKGKREDRLKPEKHHA